MLRNLRNLTYHIFQNIGGDRMNREGKKCNVIKLRDDEPSGYYCLDGIFI